MNGFDVRQSRFRKVHGNVELEAGQGPTGTVEAIVCVERDGYVPAGVKVRARIDATMLTGEMPASLLPRLENDPLVASVAVSRRVRVLD
jgi:hypothetical protein